MGIPSPWASCDSIELAEVPCHLENFMKLPEGPKPEIISTGPATGFLPARDSKTKPITVIGTPAIRETFDAMCLHQALNSRGAPGVTDLVLNPDAHCGYGAPVGCVMVSPTHIYPGPIGVDIKCSMSLLQLDLPESAVADKPVRRALIDAIGRRTPTGAGRGSRSVKNGRKISPEVGFMAAVEGASPAVCAALGIPPEWASRCEDSAHLGHDGTVDALAVRLEKLIKEGGVLNFDEKARQLGSYGGGNHFGECEIVKVRDNARAPKKVAETFGLRDNNVAFLSHCGSRGLGHALASGQFKALQEKFAAWSIPLPGNDRELVYAPLGTPEADAYLDDLALGANFATVNHLLINALVREAFQEVIPGTNGDLVYFISHNIAREEVVDGKLAWVHRKGATRAFPGGHHALKNTPFAETGHPILASGKSTQRVGGDGRRCQDGEELLQREPRRGPADGSQGRHTPARSENGRCRVGQVRYPEQLPELSHRRSARCVQGFRRGAGLSEESRTGERSRPAQGAVCD